MSTPTPAVTLGQRFAGLLAVLGVLGIIAGLPLLLIAIGANPLPSQTPTWAGIKTALLAPDDGTLVLGVLAVVAWIAWAFMTLSILVELAARLRGVRAPTLPGLGRPQAAARGLIATAALLFVAVPIASQAASAPAEAAPLPTSAAAHQAVTSPTVTDQAPEPTSQPTANRVTTEQKQAPTITHTVKSGESLWSIAEAHLGDGARYKEIAELNRAVVGSTPGFLETGWVLELPAPPDKDTPATNDPGQYTVRPGDTLSEIAQDKLGSADRYMEIFDASTGLDQPGGARLSDPDLIDVGWTLNMPGSTDHDGKADRDPAGPRRDHTPEEPAGPENNADPDTSTPDSAPESTPDTALPETPEASTPEEVAPEPAAPAVLDQAADVDEEDSVLTAPWVLAGLTGGGVLLSGALFMALQSRRRAQFRGRRPGRTIAAPDPELAPVEMTITATGAPAAATVEFMHEALRRLTASIANRGAAMPPLAAVELGAGTLTLHLSGTADLPAPWQGAAEGTRWSCPVDIDLDDLGPAPSNVETPYPLLVTIGMSDAGETWLLNCEELATLTIAGDPTYGRDFARHLAAQLAVNPWSRTVELDCVGVAEEAADMDDRITFHATSSDASTATSAALAHAVATVDRASSHGTDVSTARTGEVDGDSWPARMLLLDAAAGDPTDLDQLLRLLADQVGKTATSIVVAGERADTPGAVLRMTSTGRVTLDAAGLDLIAVGLTSDEARGCALVYAQSENTDDVEVPVDETATEGWEAYADQSGALRREHTLPRSTPDSDDEPLSTLLEGDDEDYIRESPVVAEDLDTLAPKVPARVREEVEAADPTLDADIEHWFASDCPRPRLSLLGPITARTRGKALTKRKPYFTELLAFLALRRRHGVTMDEICDAFGIDAPKARDYLTIVRGWLGTNQAGDPYLPYADKAPMAETRGQNIYQVDDGLLVDADLFRRLHLRAKARGGADGLHDLITALELVSGRPFDEQRNNGWSWLHNGERHDEYMKVAIADVAFTVTTWCLTNGDLPRARAATEIAVLAAPDEETTRLCLVRLTEAEGDRDEAARILREEICNRTDDDAPPPELSERTETIIRTHEWLAS